MTAPSTDAAPQGATSVGRERSPGAAIAVVVSGILALFFAPASLGLVRDTLHFNCSWDIGGEWGPDGSWFCADGIGYLGVAAVVGVMSVGVLLAGLLLVFVRPSFRRSMAYLALVALSLAWIGGWTFAAAISYTGARPAGETGPGLWAMAVLPALALCTLGLLVGAVGALSSRRWSPVLLWGGVGLMLIGTVLQPGIGVATIVSAGMLVAAGRNRAL